MAIKLISSFLVVIFLPLSYIYAEQSDVSLESSVAETVEIVAGKSIVLQFSDALQSVVVGDDSIADVNVISSNEVYILGKSVGSTNIQLSRVDVSSVLALDVLVTVDTKELKMSLDQAIPTNALEVIEIASGVGLKGSVTTAKDRDVAISIAEQFVPIVIDMVTVDTEVQVQLRVDILEIATSRLKELDGLPFAELILRGSGGSTISGTFSSAFELENTITALAQQGYAQYLASPTLTTLSGTTASFLAGGEIPIASESAAGAGSSVLYKEYGVRLSFTPTLQPDGKIQITLEPEVSQVDQTLSQDFGAAFSTRKANTTASLNDGDVLLIAGLMQSTRSTGIAGLPLLSEIPLLGALFRDTEFNSNATELVILVSPTIQLNNDLEERVNDKLNLVNLDDTEELFMEANIAPLDKKSLRELLLSKPRSSGKYGFILK